MQAELHGILPVRNTCFEPLQQSAVHWSNTLKQAAAVCNSLTMVNKRTVAGFDVERELFKAVEARFLVRQEQSALITALHHRPSALFLFCIIWGWLAALAFLIAAALLAASAVLTAAASCKW